MPQTTVVYTIGEIKQLIELNGNLVNFNLEFVVKSLNGEPFKAVVMSDEELNSGEEIKFQNVDEGIISGNLVNENNIHRVYFLVLKADSTIQCEVSIVSTEIPGKDLPVYHPTQNEPMVSHHVFTDKQSDSEICIFGMNIPIITIILIIGLAVGIFIFFCYTPTQKTTPPNTSKMMIENTSRAPLDTSSNTSISPVTLTAPTVPNAQSVVTPFTKGVSTSAVLTAPSVVAPVINSAGNMGNVGGATGSDGNIESLKNKLEQFFGSD